MRRRPKDKEEAYMAALLASCMAPFVAAGQSREEALTSALDVVGWALDETTTEGDKRGGWKDA